MPYCVVVAGPSATRARPAARRPRVPPIRCAACPAAPYSYLNKPLCGGRLSGPGILRHHAHDLLEGRLGYGPLAARQGRLHVRHERLYDHLNVVHQQRAHEAEQTRPRLAAARLGPHRLHVGVSGLHAHRPAYTMTSTRGVLVANPTCLFSAAVGGFLRSSLRRGAATMLYGAAAPFPCRASRTVSPLLSSAKRFSPPPLWGRCGTA